MEHKKVKTRMSPSPTGVLHVGTAHTALFNLLFARQYKGSFIIRIEDTDAARSTKEFEKNILEELAWLGIESDEPVTRQSERGNIYRPLLERLLQEHKAFYCSHSVDDLEAERVSLMGEGCPPVHHCDVRDGSALQGIIRIKNDAAEPIKFHDDIRGEISFDPAVVGDFVIAKSLDAPLYHFTVVVDDSLMEITHVIRGDDHIANTPKQILIQRALGYSEPVYAHLPLLLGTDRSKLSKRHGATSVTSFREMGYLPEAFCNFLALLGWNPGTEQEIFNIDDLIQNFSLQRVQKSGAIFDIVKLDWMNGEYIRTLPTDALYAAARPFLAHIDDQYKKLNDEAYVISVIKLEQSRIKKLSELADKIDYFFHTPEYEASLLIWKDQTYEELGGALRDARELIDSMDFNELTVEAVELPILERANTYPSGRGGFLWPLRAALSGKKSSPGPFEIIAVLGKENTIKHIDNALSKLSAL